MEELVEKILSSLRTNQIQTAENQFKLLLQRLKPVREPSIFIGIAYEFSQLGFIPYANAILDMGQKIKPNDRQWLLAKGELLIDNGQADEALDLLLQIQPQHEEYLQSLLLEADAYQMLNLSEMSLAKLQEAQRLAPDEEAISFGIAELFYSQREFKDAIPLYEVLEESVLEESLEDLVSKHLTYALMQNGQFEDVAKRLEEIPSDERSNEELEMLGAVYAQLEDYEKANSLLMPLYENGELSLSNYVLLSQVKIYYHNFDEAERILKDAVSQDPYSEALANALAQFYLTTKQEDKAEEALLEVLKIDNEEIGSLNDLIRLYLEQDRQEEASEWVEKGKAQETTSPDFYWLSAQVEDRLDEVDIALEDYEKAYQYGERDENFWRDYLQFLRSLGEWSKIKAILNAEPEGLIESDFDTLREELYRIEEERGEF